MKMFNLILTIKQKIIFLCNYFSIAMISINLTQIKFLKCLAMKEKSNHLIKKINFVILFLNFIFFLINYFKKSNKEFIKTM